MEYRDELEIAQKAEQMLTGAIRNKTNSFADHYNGKKEDEPSLKQASAKSYVKKYGRKKDGNQQIFLRRLVIRMARHGFVQHYGVNSLRAGGFRKSKLGNSYHYDAHDMEMRAQPFIGDAIKQSDVVEFVSQNVAELRAKNFAEELIFPLSHFAK
ncbi:MAG: hypothetical protein HG446_000340 [Flavobacteriaceae bacterium]|jgi:hypothetical protein|nr:hypothetical protein [Flavobacteriaceae bacterium]MBB1560331.1 hypothetical protein [Flavobacteriaceae bacterium]